MKIINNSKGIALAVDLDGTLSQSDFLIEGLWSIFCESPFRFLRLFSTLSKGRAVFKKRVTEESSLNIGEVPLNEVVIRYIQQWKKAGGEVVLVTAADQSIADKVNTHVQLFDGVYGSDGKENLKADQKAEFLCKRYGSKGFAYIGNSTSDIKVWEHASDVIVVNPSLILKSRLKKRFENIECLDVHAKVAHVFALLRPHQWLKNILVFLPVFAAQAFVFEKILQSALAFLVFSIVASAVYVVNDLFDIQSDRKSPFKKHRPIASGKVQISTGIAIGVIAFAVGLSLAFLIKWDLFLILCFYSLLNFLYSTYLKKLIVIDICCLGLFYVLRVYAGSLSTEIGLSFWLVAFSLFLFLALGAIKRMNEIVKSVKSNQRAVHGRGYLTSDLSVISQISVGFSFSSIVLLALYLNSANVVEAYNNPSLLWGLVLLLIFWLNRLIILTSRADCEEPLLFFIKDKTSLLCATIGAVLIYAASI